MAGESTALQLTTPSTVDFYIMHRFLEIVFFIKEKKRLAMDKKSLPNKRDFSLHESLCLPHKYTIYFYFSSMPGSY